jgi:hypothetical protein
MLPKDVTDLLEGFVRGFDSDRPAVIEFRKAHNNAAQSFVGRGFGVNCSVVIPIGQKLTSYLEEKAKFVWGKLQEVVISLQIAAYPDFSNDLKSQVAAHFNPTRQAAENYLENVRVGFKAPTGYTVENKRAFDNILTKINAEVDLFCAAYTVRMEKINQTGGTTYNFDKFTGVFGPVTNSEVSVHDNSSIYKLLIDHNVPMRKRHELEEIMEELKTASPEIKPSIMQRGKNWIVENKEFLGASAEIVSKIFG